MTDYVAKYRCRCSAEYRDFVAPWRRPDQDIGEWLETAVRPAMTAAHRKHSPLCMATTADLMLPADGADEGRPIGSQSN